MLRFEAHTGTVEKAIAYLHGQELCPPFEDCIFEYKNSNGNLLVGFTNPSTNKNTWIFSIEPISYNSEFIRDLSKVKYSKIHYLYAGNTGTLKKQVQRVKVLLSTFMGYVVDNRILLTYGIVLDSFNADISASAWSNDNALNMLEVGGVYSDARKTILGHLFDNNFNDSSRAVKFLIAGIHIEYIKELWSLPDSWVIESDKDSKPLLVSNPMDSLFNTMFG